MSGFISFCLFFFFFWTCIALPATLRLGRDVISDDLMLYVFWVYSIVYLTGMGSYKSLQDGHKRMRQRNSKRQTTQERLMFKEALIYPVYSRF